ncbi:MAG: hypothetical protein KY468_13000 [Armatimonadetes bacterium]|nr:hypothetical protein [Armatimonadota bacterium]
MPSNTAREGVTLRSVLLAFALIPLHCYWITLVEVRWNSMDGTALPLMITPIFILFCASLLNLLLRRWIPRHALSQGELLTVYIAMVISGVFASHDMIQNLFGSIGHAAWFARPENRWQELFFHFIPWWLFVRDRSVLRPYYEGNASPWDAKILLAWMGPLLWWAAFMMAVIFLFLGVNLILRRHWTQHERLSFPLVQLPLAMTAERDAFGFYRSRLTWIGFGIAFGIGLTNGLGTLYPSVPYFAQVKQFDIGRNITTVPWNAVGYTPISMYPFAIGLGYFIPLDLSFSIWFFFLWRKLWQVFGRVVGLEGALTSRGFPAFTEQSMGAWLTLSLVLLWGLRGYLKETLRMAAEGPASEDPAEARRLRWAYGMILIGAAFLLFFWHRTGLSVLWMSVYMGLFFLLSLTITRVRAELGAPHGIFGLKPQHMIVEMLGSRMVPAQDLTVMNATFWMHRGYRSHPMPAQLEAFKMAENGRMNLNRLIGLIASASLLSIFASYWANLQITYHAGAGAQTLGFKSFVGNEAFNQLANYLNSRQPPTVMNLVFDAMGAVVVIFLSVMRNLFLGWPFHPAGYALAVSFAVDPFWFPFFIAWTLKSLLIRYGGMKMHNAFVPFFLGLILGDFTIGSIWALVGPILGIQTYKIYV